MDDLLIYLRTPAGEEVMRQPTRLVQRNLRAVMSSVDGVANVAELKRQVGDGRMVEASLAELEGLGLVETLATREERQKRETAAKEAPLDRVPADASPKPVPPAQEAKAQVWEVVLGDSPGDQRPPGEKAEPDSRPSQGRAEAPAKLTRLRDGIASWRQKRKARKEERAFRRAYETPTEEESLLPIKLKPIRRGPRRRVIWPVLLIGGLLLFAGGALLLAAAFPYERFRPEIEQRLAAALGDPVTIAALRFSFRPYPNITLERVSVGGVPYAQAKAIRVVPDPFSLFGSNWVIRHAALEAPVLRQQGIAHSLRWFTAALAQDRPLVLRRVHVDDLAVELGDSRVSGLSGDVAMKAEGGVARLLLQNSEHSLHLEVVPAAAGYQLSVIGNALKMPFKPDLVFEYLEAEGEMTPGELRFRKLAGKLYGGIIEGSVELDWSQAATLLIDIGLTRASSSRLLAGLSLDLSMEGDIGGRLHIESRARDFSQLGDNLRINGEFLAERGVINRFDFMEAVRSNRPTRGGNTRFERLSGALQSSEHAWHLGRLDISSGLMQATGNLDIARDMQLKGLMELQLKGPATRLNASVLIGGTLPDPQLLPARIARQ